MNQDITFPFKVIVQNQGMVTFPTQDCYIAQGGQGYVLKLNDQAYKIYHDPKTMIPAEKVQELSILKKYPNILCPLEVLFDPNKPKNPIGFSMPYVRKTEFLVRLFNRTFKQDNRITPDTVAELVKNLQTGVQNVHNESILIVDLNEMNFLTDSKTYTTPYFIDVDNYETKKHRTTAIMESIRDPKVQKNQWTKNSDWFSFGIVAFQLYTNLHPYWGKHPDFKLNQWQERMKLGVSVFDKAVTFPPGFMGWDVIPKAHLDWFRKIFQQGERSVPPYPDGALIITVARVTDITSTGKFEVTPVAVLSDRIISVSFHNGVRYAITTKQIYRMDKPVLPTPKTRSGLLSMGGHEPILAVEDQTTIKFTTLDGKECGSTTFEQAMEYGGALYTIYNDRLIETRFEMFQQPMQMTKTLTSVSGNTKLYRGVAVQDALGKHWLAIPFLPGKCTNIPVPELDGYRIVVAKYENRYCQLMGERSGKYTRFVLYFSEDHTTYKCRSAVGPYIGISFAVNAKGICVSALEDQAEICFGDSKISTHSDSPFDPDTELLTDGLNIMFIDDRKLYQVRLK